MRAQNVRVELLMLAAASLLTATCGAMKTPGAAYSGHAYLDGESDSSAITLGLYFGGALVASPRVAADGSWYQLNLPHDVYELRASAPSTLQQSVSQTVLWDETNAAPDIHFTPLGSLHGRFVQPPGCTGLPTSLSVDGATINVPVESDGSFTIDITTGEHQLLGGNAPTTVSVRYAQVSELGALLLSAPTGSAKVLGKVSLGCPAPGLHAVVHLAGAGCSWDSTTDDALGYQFAHLAAGAYTISFDAIPSTFMPHASLWNGAVQVRDGDSAVAPLYDVWGLGSVTGFAAYTDGRADKSGICVGADVAFLAPTFVTGANGYWSLVVPCGTPSACLCSDVPGSCIRVSVPYAGVASLPSVLLSP